MDGVVYIKGPVVAFSFAMAFAVIVVDLAYLGHKGYDVTAFYFLYIQLVHDLRCFLFG